MNLEAFECKLSAFWVNIQSNTVYDLALNSYAEFYGNPEGVKLPSPTITKSYLKSDDFCYAVS